MDIKKALAEKRVRAAVKNGNGRALLDLMRSNPTAAEHVLNDMGAAAGTALADAIRVARADEDISGVIIKAGQSGDPSALDAVRGVLGHGAPDALRTAIGTLSVHGTPEDLALVADCLTHPDADVRRTAFDTLSGADHLPAHVSEILTAERTRLEEAKRAAYEAELRGPFTARSAATTLVGICNRIDATYVEPIPLDVDDRRTALRDDIARVGEGVYAQGGEDLMRDVVRLVTLASTHGNYLSREWSGIGGWIG